MDKITLDREVFKALASDTRLDILKALDVRQKTVTELAKELELNKATVFEHLEKLATVGLIQKLEDDRKWVYWQLTWTGKRLLHPEKITLAILLSTSGGALLAGLASLWMWFRSNVPADDLGAKEQAGDTGMRTIAAEAPPEAPVEAAAHDPVLLWVAVGFAVLTVALLAWALWTARRARAKKAAAGA